MARHAHWPSRFDGHEYPQVIPDPDDVRAGAVSPWSSLGIEKRTGIDMATVERRVIDAGRRAVLDTYPSPNEAQTRVLDGVDVVLTRRSFTLRFHRGEIALPGGRRDDGETPVMTALREAREEVGIEESSVDYLGWLSPLVTVASGSSITPIVGRLARRPELAIDQAEVDRAFTVALDDLLADGVFLEERWRRDASPHESDEDGYFPINFFRVPGDLIWGATARVLTELLCIVTGVGWPGVQ